jgi:uncharacterized protein (TIGR02996 family)
MRTFIYTDERSNKFWNIELSAASFTVQFGRVGSAGQTQVKTFPDEAQARKEHDKLIREKLGKGYVETTPAEKPVLSLRESLEQALAENLDDLATHMAYADHLTEQGDTRGEFISVQLALEDPARPAGERERLRQREQQLLQAHQAEWLGAAAPMFLKTRAELEDPATDVFGLDRDFSHNFGRESNHFDFARGWLEGLELGCFGPRLAEALGNSPTIGLLQRLTITHSEEAGHGYDVLAAWPCLAGLRRFQIGPDPDKDQCHIDGYGLVPALTAMPRLEALYLYAHGVEVDEMFALPMPHLRTLYAYHLHEYPLEVLAANPSLGKLTTLACWPHALEPEDDRAYIQLDDFRALIRSPHLKALTHLALHLTDVGDEGMAALVESGLLSRLRVLDLHQGRVTDEGARILAGCPDLPRLERLRLSQNQLTPEGVALLQATGVPLEAAGQHAPESIAENAHLWDGDME